MITGFDEMKVCEAGLDFKELLACDVIRQKTINIESIKEIDGHKCLEIRLSDFPAIHPMIVRRYDVVINTIKSLAEKDIIDLLKSTEDTVYVSMLPGFYGLLSQRTMEIALSKAKPDLKIALDKYKELMKEHRLPKVLKISDKRRKMVNARIREYGLDTFLQTLDNAGRSEYLMSQIGAGSWYTFDWIFNKNNFLKISEQKYNKAIDDPVAIAESLRSEGFETANKIVRF